MAKLLGYYFEILYKAGTTTRVAYALSRRKEGSREEEKELRAIARPYWQDFQEVLKEVKEDEVLVKVIEDIQKDLNSHSTFTLEQDRLHYKVRLVLSAKSIWIPKLLVEFHMTRTRGHSSVYRT
ncbi:uncharacterized protein LOC124841869 [Vigna umbellata]|uniref:uncharacterized protein LOC124841869 n=1 Tax=Vigna umbellata TaxID=87088 RepID=UPI001F5F9F91|nr:uncharacterized protein LOC124841869 [Vigna umbellata]